MKKFYIIFSFLILISNLSFSQTPTMLQGGEKRDVSLKKSMDFLGYVQKVEDEMNSLV